MEGTGWWVEETLHGAGPWVLLSWIFWVIFSITLHELGHGVAAIRVGDDTPIRLNRMTMNPLVHMGPTSLIVFAVIGIAWGAMPVNPHRFRGKHADALVAAAGPAVNVGLFAICIVAFSVISEYMFTRPAYEVLEKELAARAAQVEPADESQSFEKIAEEIASDFSGFNATIEGKEGSLSVMAREFFFTGALLNAVLLVLNLLPIPPLDGSRILASFSGSYRRLAEGPHATTIALIAILFIFLSGSSFIWGAGGWLTGEASSAITSILP